MYMYIIFMYSVLNTLKVKGSNKANVRIDLVSKRGSIFVTFIESPRLSPNYSRLAYDTARVP